MHLAEEIGANDVITETHRIEVELNILEILTSVTNMLEFGRVHTQAARIALALEDHSVVDAHLKIAQEIFIKLGAELELARIHKLTEYRNIAQG